MPDRSPPGSTHAPDEDDLTAGIFELVDLLRLPWPLELLGPPELRDAMRAVEAPAIVLRS